MKLGPVGAAGRTWTMWVVGTVAVGAVVVASVVGLQTADRTSAELTTRAVPAQNALQTAMVNLASSQASFMVAIETQDATARAAAITSSQTLGQAATTAWTAYLSHALNRPGEMALQKTYASAAVSAQQAGAKAILMGAAAPGLAAAVALERGFADDELATVTTVESTIYAPLVSGGIATIGSGINRSREIGFAVSGGVVLLFTLSALVLVRGARRDQRVLTEEAAMLRTSSDRAEFEGSLQRGLEMQPSEETAFDVVRQALVMVGEGAPAELLLADSSRAHFRQVFSTDRESHAGCQVGVPAECPAASSSQTQVFDDSRHLDSCRFVRGREEPVWAVCVPVSVAGRTTGVIHAERSIDAPRSDRLPVDIGVVGRKAGERLGSLRVLARTEVQAQTDPLTGLPNRRTLDANMYDILADNTEFVVAYADLDHFKLINDTFGHETGDRALRLFARVLRDSIRPRDLVARHGGEEFLVVLPECSLADARSVAERVRSELASVLGQATLPPFTVTIGLAPSEAGDAFSDVVARADAAMLSAKALGRNRIIAVGDVIAPPASPTPTRPLATTPTADGGTPPPTGVVRREVASMSSPTGAGPTDGR